MKMRRLAATLAIALCAVSLPRVATASHSAVQTLQATTEAAAGIVQVGLDSRGLATAVWTEGRSVYLATRPAGDFFGPPTPLVQGGVADIAFDEAPNGNALIAVTGSMELGRLLVFSRLSRSGPFAGPQVVLGPQGASPSEVDVAISNAGRGVVAFQLVQNNVTSVRAALSDTEGSFGDAHIVDPGPAATNPSADVDAAGDALVVYSSQSEHDEVRAASAMVDAGLADSEFSPPVVIETLERGPTEPDVAVNATGAAVVVYEDLVSANECCSRDKVEARYGSVDGTFGGFQNVSDIAVATGASIQEAAMDDSGRAAIVFSASVGGALGFFASVSGADGTFPVGGYQVLSHAPTLGNLARSQRDFGIVAGGGGFTAYWVNDHDLDGQANEVWESSTTGATFGSPHRLSRESRHSAVALHGARSSTGATVTGWVLAAEQPKAQVAPVPDGTAPDYGTGSDDEIEGTGGDDLYRLRDGDDVFSGGGGSDVVFGGSGNDVLAGGSGEDLLNGGRHKDALSGGTGNDILKGGAGSDRLSGDGAYSPRRGHLAVASDALRALVGRSDTLFGGTGSDWLKGGPGFDQLHGGKGVDLCIADSRKEKRRASGCETIKVRRGHL